MAMADKGRSGKRDGMPFGKRGKPEFGAAGGSESGRARKKELGKAGKPGFERSDKPEYGRTGKPGYGRSDKPEYGRTGKPGSTGTGRPERNYGKYSERGSNRSMERGTGRDFERTYNKSDRDQQWDMDFNSGRRSDGYKGKATDYKDTGRPAGQGKDRKASRYYDRAAERDSYKTAGKNPATIAETDIDNKPADDFDRLEGRNPVLEALRSGRSINRILISKGEKEGSINQIIAIAKQKHIVIQEIERSRLDAMSETHSHQGVIALASAKDYVEVDDILKAATDSGRPPFIIILDEITDPHNLGSLLRTSNAAGVHGIIIPKRRATGLTSVVSKASAGAIEYVPVARVTNIVQTIEYLKKQNIWVAGTDSAGDKPYYDSDLTGGLALVIGSEGEGMGKLVREACDYVVSIPMMGEISSLNAAVAGAIVIYEIVRQRNKKQL